MDETQLSHDSLNYSYNVFKFGGAGLNSLTVLHIAPQAVVCPCLFWVVVSTFTAGTSPASPPRPCKCSGLSWKRAGLFRYLPGGNYCARACFICAHSAMTIWKQWPLFTRAGHDSRTSRSQLGSNQRARVEKKKMKLKKALWCAADGQSLGGLKGSRERRNIKIGWFKFMTGGSSRKCAF